MRRFEDVSGPLRAAVAAVHAALDPLDPLPPECAGTSHTAPELTELVGSPGFMAYESAVCDLLGEVRYALLTLAYRAIRHSGCATVGKGDRCGPLRYYASWRKGDVLQGD